MCFCFFSCWKRKWIKNSRCAWIIFQFSSCPRLFKRSSKTSFVDQQNDCQKINQSLCVSRSFIPIHHHHRCYTIVHPFVALNVCLILSVMVVLWRHIKRSTTQTANTVPSQVGLAQWKSPMISITTAAHFSWPQRRFKWSPFSILSLYMFVVHRIFATWKLLALSCIVIITRSGHHHHHLWELSKRVAGMSLTVHCRRRHSHKFQAACY